MRLAPEETYNLKPRLHVKRLTLRLRLIDGDLLVNSRLVGKAVRTYHRRTIASAISVHARKHLRLEFKPLETTSYLVGYKAYFSCGSQRSSRRDCCGATEQKRIYDMGRLPDLTSKQTGPARELMNCRRRAR